MSAVTPTSPKAARTLAPEAGSPTQDAPLVPFGSPPTTAIRLDHGVLSFRDNVE